MDKFVVRNKTGNIFRFEKFKIFMNPNQCIDLCSFLNRTISEVKRDPDIMREIGYNNLEVIEEKDDAIDVNNLSGAINEILSILKTGGIVQPQQISTILDISNEVKKETEDKGEESYDNEDKMRQDALMSILSRQKAVEKKVDNFGQTKKVKDVDDFSNLIDI